MVSYTIGGTPLTEDGLHGACEKLNTGAPELWAVIFTETDPPYGGFFTDAYPQILFERHVFQKLTGKQYDAAHPEVSGIPDGRTGRVARISSQGCRKH
jgi:hypothetical protein